MALIVINKLFFFKYKCYHIDRGETIILTNSSADSMLHKAKSVDYISPEMLFTNIFQTFFLEPSDCYTDFKILKMAIKYF